MYIIIPYNREQVNTKLILIVLRCIKLFDFLIHVCKEIFSMQS